MSLEEKIKAYLKNQLSEKETADFREEIAQNPDLATKVKGWKLVLLNEESLFQERLREEMKSWEPPTDSSQSKKWIIGIAVIMIVAGIYWGQSKFSGMSQKIESPSVEDTTNVEIPIAGDTVNIKLDSSNAYSNDEEPKEEESNQTQDNKKRNPKNQTSDDKPSPKNYGPIAMNLAKGEMNSDINSLLQTTRSSSENQDSLITLSWTSKDAALFEEAMEKAALGQSESANIRGHFYFNIGDFDKAVENFEILQNDSFKKQAADWYILMSKIAQFPESIDEIKKIACRVIDNESHFYQDRWNDFKKKFLAEINNPNQYPSDFFDCN